ncbi:hypothetical protein [Protofrankia symbiont of Coriaria ruscifolia]|uniref:hypothetical protein n=1 Tax=Protofrankia symbiont of Coriaria ruscifolia TaxID=1306542 RepID=UPI0013EFB669|nr:hypothetical protein [Protofrankia symbiont of Coriaria ruscifolia]
MDPAADVVMLSEKRWWMFLGSVAIVFVGQTGSNLLVYAGLSQRVAPRQFAEPGEVGVG